MLTFPLLLFYTYNKGHLSTTTNISEPILWPLTVLLLCLILTSSLLILLYLDSIFV